MRARDRRRSNRRGARARSITARTTASTPRALKRASSSAEIGRFPLPGVRLGRQGSAIHQVRPPSCVASAASHGFAVVARMQLPGVQNDLQFAPSRTNTSSDSTTRTALRAPAISARNSADIAVAEQQHSDIAGLQRLHRRVSVESRSTIWTAQASSAAALRSSLRLRHVVAAPVDLQGLLAGTADRVRFVVASARACTGS